MYSNQPPAPQLPFPVNQVIDGNWVNDPYRDRIPVPHIPMDHQLTWIPQQACAAMIAALQQGCQAGPVSTFAYNFFSANYYGNQAFVQVMADVVDHCLFVLQRSQDRSAQGMAAVVANVAGEHALIATALTTRYYPELLRYVDQVGQQQLGGLIQRWDQICQAMDQQNQQHVAPRGGYHGQPGPAHLTTPPGSYARRGYAPNADQGQYAVRPQQSGVLAGSGYVNPARPNTGGPARSTAPVAGRPVGTERPMSDHLIKKLIDRGELVPTQPGDELADLGVTEAHGDVSQPQQGGRVPQDFQQTQNHQPVAQPQRLRPDTSAPLFKDDVPAAAPAPAVEVQAQPESEDEDWVAAIDFEEDAMPSKAVDRVILPIPPIGLSVEKLSSYYEDNAAQSFRIRTFSGDPKRPWDNVTLTNDAVLIPALQSPHTPTRTALRPNPVRPYNPKTHVKFHLIIKSTAETTVTEVIVPMEPSMEYINHELNDNLRTQEMLRSNEKLNVMPDWSVMTVIQPRISKQSASLESMFLKEQDEQYQEKREEGSPEVDQVLRKQPLILSTSTTMGSIEQVLTRADQFRAVAQSGKDGVDRVLVEGYGVAMVPFLIGTAEQEDVVKGLTDAWQSNDPAKALVDALVVYGNAVGKDRLYNRVTDLMTQAVNNVLLHSLGIDDVRITNFVGDYEELLESVLEFNGEGNHDRLKVMTGIAASRLQIIRGNDPEILDEALALDALDVEHYEEHQAEYVFLRHQFAVLYINQALSTLGLNSLFQGPEQITAGDHEHLFALITGVEQRTSSMNRKQGGTLYVVSADDRVLQLHTSAWDKNYRSVGVTPLGQHSVL